MSFSRCLFIVLLFTVIAGCNAFKHGYTLSKSLNAYSLVKGDGKSFGDKRIQYSKGYYRRSALALFLQNRGAPNFIYEYRNNLKCYGIKLFYTAADSVYVFEEPRKNNLRSALKESRLIDDYERTTYKRLLQGID